MNVQLVTYLSVFVLGTACASAPSRGDTREPAPWADAPVAASDQSASVILTEWRKAENRSACAALTLIPQVVSSEATPRPAKFSGGWAVAFDQMGQPGSDEEGNFCASCGRGSFGVAGTGVTADNVSTGWPAKIEWRDGSSAGYGLEGNVGPKHLAFLSVVGEECLYNVWSYQGAAHLKSLLNGLRFIKE